ncbi:MAG: hypothetical protein QM775_09970 [Pirellulales bacterium]
MKLAFDKMDLINILALVADEADVKIEMVDGDFLTSGITKNQSMGLDEAEQSIDKILQVILKKADIGGRLVYYAGKTDKNEDALLIGTRAGVEARKVPLLPEFQQAADPKKK